MLASMADRVTRYREKFWRNKVLWVFDTIRLKIIKLNRMLSILIKMERRNFFLRIILMIAMVIEKESARGISSIV